MESQFEDAEEENGSALLSFANEDDPFSEKSKKRLRLEQDDEDIYSNTKVAATASVSTTVSTLPAGMDRLSKWAKRLFDPDRPKGLIQPPQTIPLNDEFLKAFGKREKETDAARGITLQIDHAINDDEETESQQQQEVSRTSKSFTNKRKVKITNIKYTTTAATLEAACSNFGPVEYTNLIMDQEKSGDRNTGRAYVTFEQAESAQACVDGLKNVEQRPVTVTLATTTASSSSSSARNASASRYWQANRKDLTTKCYRCGGVGHVAADCTNAAAVKPCPLCAATDHDMRNCPIKAVCFNCGIPGHVSRECQQPRGIPQRRICTICYRTDHHKTQCRGNINNHRNVHVPPSVQAAICLSCGRSGHYLCSDLKWFFGLNGVTCCNCGMPGHIGAQCPRPILDVCSRNETTTIQEIERASTVSFVEEAIVQANSQQRQQQQQQQQQQRTERHSKNQPNERGRRTEKDFSSRNEQRRFKSMPARSGQHGGSRNECDEQSNNSNNNGNDHRRNQQLMKKQRTSRWVQPPRAKDR